MGKYMEKSKLTGGIAVVMEVSPQPSHGFRTRAAKTLALQRLNKSSSHSAAVSSPGSLSPSSYLQLRSRRLQKPPTILRRPQSSTGSEKGKIGGQNWYGYENFSGVVIGGSAGEIRRSLVRNSSTNETSQSTRMETISHTTNSRVEMELLKSIPTANDIEEFFAREELWHQRTFIQKYNFDFASEMPLQGRYKWVQVVP